MRPPDGYTLLCVAPSSAINATLYDKLNFNFIRDIAPVAGIVRMPLVMVVNPSVPAKTVPEFIAYAKANPGKINMASPGVGTSLHVSGELFKMMAGVDMVHVPYSGAAPALTDLLGGQVQVMFAPHALVNRVYQGRQAARAGGDHRDALGGAAGPSDVGEFLPGYEASTWYGVGAPMGTPAEDRRQAQQGDQCRPRRSQAEGAARRSRRHTIAGSPGEFGKLIADETEKWAKVIRSANIKPE